jgi:hypothetical protein
MKIPLLFFAICLLSNTARAQSTVVGAWIEDGKKLAIQVVDNPSEPSFTAGTIWMSLAGGDRNKSLKTDNLEIKCAGVAPVPVGDPYGSCKITLGLSTCVNNGSKWACGIWKDEAKQALLSFIQSPDDILVKYSNDDFIFQASHSESFVGLVISRTLIR